MTNEERATALRDLIELRLPVDAAVHALSVYAWDSEQELARIDRSAAIHLLDAYLQERVSSEEVARWANAIEGRDDVALDPGSEEMLKDFIFEMATPELTESLTVDRASWWKARLTDGGEQAIS